MMMKWKSVALALFAALAWIITTAGCAHPSAEGPRPIAIAGARLEPGDGKPVIDYSIVIIERGKFIAVGPQTSVPMPKEADILDGLGHTLVPVAGGTIAVGQPANLDMKGPKPRSMRDGQWQQ